MIFQQGQLHREQFFLDGEPVQVPARPGMPLPQFPVLLHQRGWRSGRWRPRFTGRSDGRQRPEQSIRHVLQPRYPPLQGPPPCRQPRHHRQRIQQHPPDHGPRGVPPAPAASGARPGGIRSSWRSGVVSLPGPGPPESGPIPPPGSPADPIRRRPIGERPALRRGRDPPQGPGFSQSFTGFTTGRKLQSRDCNLCNNVIIEPQ